ERQSLDNCVCGLPRKGGMPAKHLQEFAPRNCVQGPCISIVLTSFGNCEKPGVEVQVCQHPDQTSGSVKLSKREVWKHPGRWKREATVYQGSQRTQCLVDNARTEVVVEPRALDSHGICK